ncbi:MAG: metal-dependent transcriptional regulator [Armatimonadetes bacterium]|nr:metal-dependent transcriptional regulator [Armatimonadota bacterium]
MEDYLKAIYKVGKSEGKVTTSATADRMKVSAASVTNMFTKLANMKLIRHTPYQGVELTEAGERVALEVIRHHRLMELYLSQILGMSWDKVDAEAERLEHVISDEFEDRIADALGQPTRDPHGAPIPGKDGTIDEGDDEKLSNVEVGQSVVVRRVSDRDPDILRYLESLGLLPDRRVILKERGVFHGPLVITVAEKDHAISENVASNVWVSRQ